MAARVFSVEFRSAVARRILNGESVDGAARRVQDQAQCSLPLARCLSEVWPGRLQEDEGPAAGRSGGGGGGTD